MPVTGGSAANPVAITPPESRAVITAVARAFFVVLNDFLMVMSPPRKLNGIMVGNYIIL